MVAKNKNKVSTLEMSFQGKNKYNCRWIGRGEFPTRAAFKLVVNIFCDIADWERNSFG